MTAAPTAFPLCWPPGWPRTPRNKRVDARRRWSSGGKPWTFNAARVALSDELDALGAKNVILSSNYELRLDGNPRAGAPAPEDVGVAVYFTKGDRPLVMARDAFTRAEENIRSLTLALEAMRALERHGGAVMMERAFTGFEALPAPPKWFDILGVPPTATRDQIEGAFRKLAIEHHPDRGGLAEKMAELNAARRAALEARP